MATPVTSTCVITARDLNKPSVTDPLYNRWTVGKLRHVIAALRGRRVVVTTDSQSGHAIFGCRLIRAFEGGAGRGPRLTVEYDLGDGDTQRTNFYVPSLGDTIVPFPGETWGDRGPKWEALDRWRTENRAAIERAQHEHMAEHPYGRWEASPLQDGISVSYTPLPNPPPGTQSGRFGHWFYGTRLLLGDGS
jgi:hypothetical protein